MVNWSENVQLTSHKKYNSFLDVWSYALFANVLHTRRKWVLKIHLQLTIALVLYKVEENICKISLKTRKSFFDEKWPRVTFLLSHYTHVFDPWWSTALSCKRTEIVRNIIKTMWLNNNDILQTFHKFNNNQLFSTILI